MSREPATLVYFRIWEDEVLALFPDQPFNDSGLCTCYAHIGQHSGADFHFCMQNSIPATAQEAQSLVMELIRQGYRLRCRPGSILMQMSTTPKE